MKVALPFFDASAKTDLACFFGCFKLYWIMAWELGALSVYIMDFKAFFIRRLGPFSEPTLGCRLVSLRLKMFSLSCTENNPTSLTLLKFYAVAEGSNMFFAKLTSRPDEQKLWKPKLLVAF